MASSVPYDTTSASSDQCAVSALLHHDSWSTFASGSSGSNTLSGSIAIGTPTLEMFAASWNAKGYGHLDWDPKTLYLTYAPTGDTGHLMMGEGDPGAKDKLFYPRFVEGSDRVHYGYMLATVGQSKSQWSAMEVGAVGVYGVSTAKMNFRPVVRLPAGVKAIKGSNGKWTFSM